MTNELNLQPAELLIELLEYIEQVEKQKKNAAFKIPTEFFAAPEADIAGLPGVEFNLVAKGDDVWLRVPRLKEILAPELGDALDPWVMLSKSPEKLPELRQEIGVKGKEGQVIKIALSSMPEIKNLFDWYVEQLWTPWSTAERPRRRTCALYSKLFSLQQTMATEGAETPLELVWGMGQTVWKRPGASTVIKHPLITQVCDLTLNEQSYSLEVRPRDIEPRLELDCYADLDIPGVPPLDAFWQAELGSAESRISPFEPASYERILNAAVGHLDCAGKYRRPENRQLPLPGDTLCVTDTWVVFARKRSQHVFLQDIERLKKHLAAKPKVPAVIEGFVKRGSSEVCIPDRLRYRGLSSSDAGADVRELYFPMPYNDEQVAIVQQLDAGDGVVVQGPPGTGKTHTIANIICHYLAQGKRVLVTSKGESALASCRSGKAA